MCQARLKHNVAQQIFSLLEYLNLRVEIFFAHTHGLQLGGTVLPRRHHGIDTLLTYKDLHLRLVFWLKLAGYDKSRL